MADLHPTLAGVGKAIAEARKSKGMTQMALAIHLGTSRSMIAKWEAGLLAPNRDTARQLAVILGGPPEAYYFDAADAEKQPVTAGTAERKISPEDVGRTILTRRKRLGMSQDELAKRCGVSQITVSRWEKGARVLSGPNVQLVAEALNLSAEELTATVSDSSLPASIAEALEDFFRRIPLVGQVSAGSRYDLEPNAPGETLYDIIGSIPPTIMAVRVRGDSMTSGSGRSIGDGDIALVDVSRTLPEELLGRVVCVRMTGEEHMIKELLCINGRFYLRSWNPSYPAIPITEEGACIEGIVLLVLKKLEG